MSPRGSGGRPVARRPRRRRRAVATVLAALAAPALVAITVAPATATTPAPGPTPAGAPAPALPVQIVATRIRPYAPQPGGLLRIAGTLRNVSAATVTGLAVGLELSRNHVGNRGQFENYAATPDGPPPPDATAVTGATVSVPHDVLRPGAVESFGISVAVDALQLPQPWQVYEIALVATGQTTVNGAPVGPSQVGRLRSFVPYAPVDATGVGVPVRVSWVWPLVDRPHRVDQSTWTDDTLATEVAAGGRLGGLVAAGAAAEAQHRPPPPAANPRHRRHRRHHPAPAKPRPPLRAVPVTWAIDPLLVDDVARMTTPYRVRTSGGQRPGAGRAAATSWLAALKQASAKGAVLGLPYADPDVTAADHAGLTAQVQLARTTGQTLLEHDLGSAPLDYAWPPGGATDQRTLDTLFAAGVTTVLLDSSALPPLGGEPSETPGAQATVRSRDGNLTALLADDGLTAVAEHGVGALGGGALDVQRLMSELLMIQAERPSHQRDLVIAPGRRWQPRPAYAAALLSATGQIPWAQPVTLGQVAARPADTVIKRLPLTYSAVQRRAQLRHDYLSSVAALQRRVDAFAAILPPGDPQARSFDTDVLRLLSSAWRGAPIAAAAARDALAHEVTRTMGEVSIASAKHSFVTLTSHSGTVPITVSNDLDRPVNVVVRLAATPRLLVHDADVTRTIPPHRRVPIDVHATAQTSGVFPLTVTLFTPDGRTRYGTPVQIYVRSTAYGATALIITGGATTLLLLTVGIRLVRRAAAARRAARGAA